MRDAIWITWEIQRRNRSMAGALGFALHELDCRGPRFRRYVVCVARTIRLILAGRPAVIAAQNPSIVLCAVAALLRPLRRFVFVMDAHNSGVRPHEGNSSILNWFAAILMRAADVTIVTNETLACYVRTCGGTPVVVPDPLPAVPSLVKRKLCNGFAVAFVCTYGRDEPYLEVFEAARQMEGRVTIFVTGRYRGRRPLNVSPNVKFLGFLPDQDFWNMLASADAIMDLTTREHCLVCGAYEAVALGKPQILSDTADLRAYFFKGAAYARPNAASIAEAIEAVRRDGGKLASEAQQLRGELEVSWQARAADLVAAIEKARARRRGRAS